MFKFLSKFLDTNEKEINRLRPTVGKINSFDKGIKELSDDQLKAKTAEFKVRLSHGETLDDLLPEAFALVREAARRFIGERHFDVQLMAGIALHQGIIAEQKTGEGKTLSATCPLYLNALTGKGVHLVTVNDYLSRRDCGWMGPVYHALGLSCSAIIHDESYIYDPQFENNEVDWRLKHLKPITRREAYLTDITYGINSEYGFDYLRDNMVSDIKETVQRGFYFAVVDEVDSVLIDEARTPHIISAPDTKPTQRYYEMAKLVGKLTPQIDFEVDEKMHTAHITEHGLLKIEKMFGVKNIYEEDFEMVHLLEAALKAKTLFLRDRDYVVKDGKIIIVDEFTGRLMYGRRFSEGIHQSIEANEGVSIQQESRTLATVSLQNYFRMYEKLAGMTGTASTEAEEFHKIYNLDVVIIPTNRQMIRKDFSDSVYKTQRAKYAAVVREIEDCYKRGQPILVGTTSIDKNEIIGDFLRHKGIPHNLLNAKNHQAEAGIIAQAGIKKMVTVATNMAGRGVDIILGGSPPDKYVMSKGEYEKAYQEWKKRHEEIVSLGGLMVIGTERHESRRIDNQLRGRAGRQGDPGASRFYVSLDDDIMRLFGGDQVARLMTVFNMPEDVPLEHPMVSKAIEQAQVKVEGFNFDSRKHLVEYDDVMNKQREIIYCYRRKILEAGEKENDLEIRKEIIEKIKAEIENTVAVYAPEGYLKREIDKIIKDFVSIIHLDLVFQEKLTTELAKLNTKEEIVNFLFQMVDKIYEEKEKQVTPEIMRQVERWVCLSVIDNLWMDHLDSIDDLREGVGLRGYGQRDPLVEYKNEAFKMFESLMIQVDDEIIHRIFKVQVAQVPQVERPRQVYESPAGIGSSQPQQPKVSPVVSGKKKVGRNDKCPCGSGKKYKKCCYPKYD